MITIFTPAYNRAHTLERLYQSLCHQLSKDFIWLIVDDGSTDNTNEMIRQWIRKGEISIEYYYQNNAGKSNAHNKGVALAHTELFVCVDSDDYLTDDAVFKILSLWKQIKATGMIGILAFRGYKDGRPITRYSLSKETTGTLKDLYRKKVISGDTMLIYRTELLKKHMFPQFGTEKFVPEAYLYDQLDEIGKLHVLPQILYIGEYLADGYTRNMAKLIVENPKGYLAWITQRLKKDIRKTDRVMDSIRYISVSLIIPKKRIIKDAVYPGITFFLFPAGWLFYRCKYHKLISQRKAESNAV